MKSERRTVLKKLFASIAGITGLGLTAGARTDSFAEKEVFGVKSYQDIPMFSTSTKLGNLVFISGRGARLEGDIKVHTDNVLKIMETELVKAGSSMEKVLKVTVYLDSMDDYKGMNEVYKGRFGKNPPVRTTVAVSGGLPPADAYIQMDCIGYI
jgi:enamine deaminase RidA (YjgF/YER057c/UK114 family)